MTTPRTRRLLASAAALTLLGLGAIACSSGAEDSADSASVPASAPSAADAPRDQSGKMADEVEASTAFAAADGAALASTAKREDADPTTGPSLIKTGNVALRSDDVATARFEVQKIVDTYAGEVSESSTETGKDGEEARARMVIRVPVDSFDDARADIAEVGEKGDLISSNSSAEDVTTQVIDTDVRVQLQRRSIQRISVLLDRANSIRDIVSIERELSRREADLGSLEKRQAYLSDQTSMGTITVSIELPPVEKKKEEAEPEKKKDEGFVAGLKGGWDAFGSATVNVLTGVGAVLPFALLLLVVGVPALLVVRRNRRTPSAADPDDAVVA